MNTCFELLADIVAVFPVPVGTFQFAVPPQVVQYRVLPDAITLPSTFNQSIGDTVLKSLRSAIRQQPGFVVDTYIYNTNPDGIPQPSGTVIIEFGTSAKESSKQDTSGKSYTTKVSMRSYEDIDKIRAIVERIQDCEAFDLFIIDEEERIYCCRGMEPATQISMQTSLPITTASQIEIEVVSPFGLLPIIM